MSGPITTNYSLTAEIGAMVTAIGEKIQDERRRIEAERARRLSDQNKTLETGEWRWRADNLYNKILVLQDEIRSFQHNYPDLASVSLNCAPPPVDNAIDALKTYVSEITKTITETRQKLKSAKASVQVARTIESMVATGGTARKIQDSLPQLAPRDENIADTEDTQIEQSLTPLQEGITSTVRQFLAQNQSALPEQLANQVQELFSIRDESQAVALGVSIRQALVTEQTRIDREKAEAQHLLGLLNNLPQEHANIQAVRERMNGVLTGKDQLTDNLRESVTAIRNELIEQERLRDSQTADILSASLADLGYKVEPIKNTLSVARGGTFHFRKPGWEKDYFVRMRVDTKGKTMNFNVVKICKDTNQGVAAQKKQDTMVEHAWCNEFDKLQGVFKTRGIDMEVTRRLYAGEIPVQTVQPESINPDFREQMQRYEQDQIPHQNTANTARGLNHE